MERLTIWSGILILLLRLSCLESRSDLGGHSEVPRGQNHGMTLRKRFSTMRMRLPRRYRICLDLVPEADCPVTSSEDDKRHTPHMKHEAAPGPRFQGKNASFLIVS
ncbi:hypothetical protein BV898_12279 [Hypsibius exemplaris]|uniref:Uncharacterized protein n=1 Tax=Hypsibius exemplaris TaxID=2072580 RepID=A0A1W0WE97_HYPEX|nr:hypothetical protein BV898_12279 [Hypsibius exemplaris]